MKQNNILFTHNTINNRTPLIFKNYFTFHAVDHDHSTVNKITSTYSIPEGSLELPCYNKKVGETSTRYICSSTWNSMLKELSVKYPEKYEKDPFWISKSKIVHVKHTLKEHFLDCY